MDNASDQYRYPWAKDNTNDAAAFDPNLPYYVFHPSKPVHDKYWKEICPPSKKANSVSSFFFSSLPNVLKSGGLPSLPPLDVSITWRPDENPRDVAKRIVNECAQYIILPDDQDGINSIDKVAPALEDNLVESLNAYRDFCQMHMVPELLREFECYDGCSSTLSQSQKLKCRLVATRGYSGAKCPQFHIDNVPCRWIQSMLGPGVDLVSTSDSGGGCGSEVIRWDAFSRSTTGNNEDENDEDEEIVSWSAEDRNQLLVDLDKADIYHSKQGEAIVIPGSSWDEYALVSASVSTMRVSTIPVVHKSPETLDNDQCRVLFTQDIIYN